MFKDYILMAYEEAVFGHDKRNQIEAVEEDHQSLRNNNWEFDSRN